MLNEAIPVLQSKKNKLQDHVQAFGVTTGEPLQNSVQ